MLSLPAGLTPLGPWPSCTCWPSAHAAEQRPVHEMPPGVRLSLPDGHVAHCGVSAAVDASRRQLCLSWAGSATESLRHGAAGAASRGPIFLERAPRRSPPAALTAQRLRTSTHTRCGRSRGSAVGCAGASLGVPCPGRRAHGAAMFLSRSPTHFLLDCSFSICRNSLNILDTDPLSDVFTLYGQFI